jgi:hypothetical protein
VVWEKPVSAAIKRSDQCVASDDVVFGTTQRSHPLDRPGLAEAVDLSLRTVQRIWQAHKLQPHRWRTFKRRLVNAWINFG